MKEAALAEGGAVQVGPGTLYGSLDRMMHSGLIEETGYTDNFCLGAPRCCIGFSGRSKLVFEDCIL